MIRTRAGISVWFACKICRQSFQNIDCFMEHKKVMHFSEFQKLNCIVFEERAFCIANSLDYNLEVGSLPPAALIKQEVISPSTDQNLDVKPAIYNVQMTTKAETGHTTARQFKSETVDNLPNRPYVLLKRLRSHEASIQSKIKVLNNASKFHANPRKSSSSLYQCRICMKIKASHNDLVLHERIHTGVMPYQCMHCARKFTWKQSWMNHQGKCKSKGDLWSKMSTKLGRPRLIKTIFRQKKPENSAIVAHEKGTHSAVEKLAKNRLPKNYTQIPKPNIRSVTVTKNRTTQYSKNIRSKLFKTKSKLSVNCSPYTCSYCSKGFSQKCNFLNHERLHTGEAPFLCDHCGSKFATASGLSYHLKKSKSSACSKMYKRVK